ncbi:MAG: HD domain-containing protein [Candidatus Oleimmundimicrobium sp.]|nr:HD domain-containing protein [Candidatus Oleimmundimicrobium sp.]
MALMYDSMGIWSIVLFFLPLLVTRHSFNLFLDIRKTYNNTIKALASIIEAQDPLKRGHAERVADISVDMAKMMGIRGKDLEIINNAALLHDIGSIGVDEESLDSLLDKVTSKNEGEVMHAKIGADILEQVDYLKGCSDIVKKHHVPYRSENKRSKSREFVPLAARIINVVSYYDELTQTREPDERLNTREAINRIKKDRGLLFDPKVVRVLMNVARMRGAFLMLVGGGSH